MVHTGSCLCGNVTVTVRSHHTSQIACHCAWNTSHLSTVAADSRRVSTGRTRAPSCLSCPSHSCILPLATDCSPRPRDNPLTSGKDCQHTSGSAFSTNILAKISDVEIDGTVKEYDSKGASGNTGTCLNSHELLLPRPSHSPPRAREDRDVPEFSPAHRRFKVSDTSGASAERSDSYVLLRLWRTRRSQVGRLWGLHGCS